MDIREKTINALVSVFGNYVCDKKEDAKADVTKHVHTGQEDPGGWAPDAVLVIHAECIPLPGVYTIEDIESWCKVSEILGDHFCEHVNDGVVAVYKS
jgi:hypothetical protein